MTIPFVLNPGGLFNRIGKLGLFLSDIRTFQNVTVVNDIAGITGQYGGEPDLTATLPGSWFIQLDKAFGID